MRELALPHRHLLVVLGEEARVPACHQGLLDVSIVTLSTFVLLISILVTGSSSYTSSKYGYPGKMNEIKSKFFSL